MQERREIRFNDGRFPACSWERGRAVQRRDSGINSASPPNEEILVINIEDDVNPSVTQASQHRSFPESCSNSSSDETSDDSLPTHPNVRPGRQVEDEETIMSKRILVDKLFVEEALGGFSCRACEYTTNSRRRLT